MKIYLAGKITGNKNAEKQFLAAEEKVKYLAEVFNPEKEFRNTDLTEKEIMLKCLEALSTCDKMILLDNYKGSLGAKIEIDWCMKFKIPIFQFAKDRKGNLIKLHHAGIYMDLEEQNETLQFVEHLAKIEQIDVFSLLGTRTSKEILLKDSLIKTLFDTGMPKIDIARTLNIHHTSVLHTIKKFEGVEKFRPDLHQKQKQVARIYLEYKNLINKVA